MNLPTPVKWFCWFQISMALSISLNEIRPWNVIKRVNEQYIKFIKDPLVQTKEGVLRGKYDLRSNIYSFVGIRYGQAPIGSRRFKTARPESPWLGIRSALKYGHVCSQIPPITGKFTGSEDCLFLNVYTKTLPNDKSFNETFPVMFYLHGGAFYTGSGNDLISGPELLVQQNVIVVTINYRLGPLGFLCVGKESAGNMGLHDQILALKWVQRNIIAFGGDPTKVTLFGFSAGAVSIDLLLLSSQAKGLFRGVISQSGSFLNPWAFANDPTKQGFRLGRALGFYSESSDELVEFLRGFSAQEVTEAAMKGFSLETFDRNPLEIVFTPCLQEKMYRTNSSIKPILKHHPIKILKSGKYKKLPYIKGFNSNEANVIFYNTLYDTKAPTNFLKSEAYFIPANLAIDKLNSKHLQVLVNDIKTAYLRFNDEVPLFTSQTLLETLTKYGTDVFFVHGITKSLRQESQNGNNHVFAYCFGFEGGFNFPTRFSGAIGHSSGTGHGDELGYLFTAPTFAYLGTNLRDTSNEIHVRNNMVKMWTNFAKYGHPTPPGIWDGNVIWEPIKSPENFTYLNIRENLELRHKMPFSKRMAFWDRLYDQYGYKLS